MGQVRHGSATTMHAVRAAIQRSQASLAQLVRGSDAETGALDWAWDMGRPVQTGLAPEGEIYTRGPPNGWAIASGDTYFGLVDLPLGTWSVDYP